MSRRILCAMFLLLPPLSAGAVESSKTICFSSHKPRCYEFIRSAAEIKVSFIHKTQPILTKISRSKQFDLISSALGELNGESAADIEASECPDRISLTSETDSEIDAITFYCLDPGEAKKIEAVFKSSVEQ